MIFAGALLMSALGTSACGGEQGSQGPEGKQGAPGPQGDKGEQGEQGIQGEIGPIGMQGIQGDPGPTGAQGIQGDPGPTGAQGIQGDPGPTGAQGLKGDPGADGSVLFKRVSISGSLNATGATSLGSISFTVPVNATGKLAVITGRGYCTITGDANGGASEVRVGAENSTLFEQGMVFAQTLAPGKYNVVNWTTQSTVATTPGVMQTVNFMATRIMGTPTTGESCGGTLQVMIVDNTKL